MKPTLDTRTFLAIFWSIVVAGILIYIIIAHGDDKGMLNLIVGYLTGIVTAVMGTYFSLNLTKDHKPSILPEGGVDTASVSVDTNTTVKLGDETVEEGK